MAFDIRRTWAQWRDPMAFIALLLMGSSALAQSLGICGALREAARYGPYDFRTDKDKLPIVLNAHFTPDIEALHEGTTTAPVAGDLSYTLQAIPNHPRALVALMRLTELKKNDQPHGARYSVECFFQRAVAYAPDDQVVRMLYSEFLIKRQRIDEAMVQLDYVRKTGDAENARTQYNLGLLYLDAGRFEDALKQAHVAAALGFAANGLQQRLEAAGKWAPPVDAVAAPASAAASAP